MRCAKYNQTHDTRVHITVAPAAAPGYAAYGKKGYTAYNADYQFKAKIKRYIARRLAKKRLLYG